MTTQAQGQRPAPGAEAPVTPGQGAEEARPPAPAGGADSWRLLREWAVLAALGAAVAFVFEKARLNGYSAYYRVPSEFIDIDPRLAYVPILQVLVPLGIAAIVLVLVARAVRRRAQRSWSPNAKRMRLGREGTWLAVLTGLVVITGLLLATNQIGDRVGHARAAGRTDYFVVGPLTGDRATIVLFMRDDRLLVRDVVRAPGPDGSSWRMEPGFRFVTLDEVGEMTRVRLGRLARVPITDASPP